MIKSLPDEKKVRVGVHPVSMSRNLASLFCLLVALLPLSTRARDSFAPEVRRSFERDGKTRALVTLTASSRKGTLAAKRNEFFRAQEKLLSKLPKGSYTVRHRYRYSPAMLLDIRSPGAMTVLERDASVHTVEADVPGSGGLNQSRAMIRADDAHELGITGEGTVVAVLDSGVAPDHPDLRDAIIHTFHSLDQGSDQGDGATDGHGHGTNVTGIVASRGLEAPRGIAPATLIVAVKILDDDNRGWVSDWTAGVDHVVQLHEEDNGIRVDAINMSLVTDDDYLDVCDSRLRAFSKVCAAAQEAGIAVFGASGNRGSTTRLTAPACFSSVYSVGAVADSLPDAICSFTSRNALLDLLAPGKPITSTGLNGGTSTFQGTSQASPHAAGLACLLRQVRSDITPADILDTMKVSGVSVFDAPTNRTFPRIDALAAVQVLQLPQIVGLTCSRDPETSSLDATWQPINEEPESIVATLIRNGQLEVSRDLPPSATSVSFEVSASGLYDLCVAAVVADQTGIETCCRTELGPLFARGECNGDGGFDIADPITLLSGLFLGQGKLMTCRRACDGDDDGELTLSDAIFLLNALFLGGALPPAPFPSCGKDPTADGLSCDSPHC